MILSALQRGLDQFWAEKNSKYRNLFLRLLIVGLAIWGIKCAQGKDFYSYYDIAMNLRSGAVNLYTPGFYSGMQNHYPPIFAFFMVPFSLLPLAVAGYIWFLIKAILLVYVFRQLPWLLEHYSIKVKPLVIFLSGLMISRYIIDDFKLGQINVLLMEALVVVLILKARKHDLAAALILGLSISFKLYPGIFLVYFLAKREFKFVLVTSLIVLGLNLIPFLAYGAQYPEVLMYFIRESITGVAAAPQSGVANQSLYGLLMRFLGHNPTDASPLNFVNFVDLPFKVIRGLHMTLCVLMAGLLFAAAWKAKKERALSALSLPFLAALLIPMVTRKSNFVLLLLPAATALQGTLGPKPALPGWARGLVWVSFFLATFTADGLITRTGSNILESYSDIGFSALLLFAVHTMFSWRT